QRRRSGRRGHGVPVQRREQGPHLRGDRPGLLHGPGRRPRDARLDGLRRLRVAGPRAARHGSDNGEGARDGGRREGIMSTTRIVVIGGGMVAHRFTEALRTRDTEGAFTIDVLAEEPRAPYDRVALTSYFTGKTPE